jgi:hypothetical protein
MAFKRTRKGNYTKTYNTKTGVTFSRGFGGGGKAPRITASMRTDGTTKVTATTPIGNGYYERRVISSKRKKGSMIERIISGYATFVLRLKVLIYILIGVAVPAVLVYQMFLNSR